ncbi:hypothetical protein AUP42_13065 [Thalassospira lucentensis]|uniref:Uncharacterized protein n=1 Tax=Thalassospira lucentensis TaxID=168935 RepID=A0A154L8Q1_9PROT|nr:hypothetical protein [Thalassospira lucentensis]KZB67269.1 hypothetical protein AUP42_13065 [Thalassospira lucentensis]
MKRYLMLAIVLLFGFASQAFAQNYNNVHVGSANDYVQITTTQLALASTDSEKTTVAQTIANSNEQSILNAYNGVGGTELLVTKFWHIGGDMYYDKTWQHITIEVYKNNSYVKTCHAYSFKTALNGPYQATCGQKAQ